MQNFIIKNIVETTEKFYAVYSFLVLIAQYYSKKKVSLLNFARNQILGTMQIKFEISKNIFWGLVDGIFFGKHLKVLTCACVHALHSEIIENIFFYDVQRMYKSKQKIFQCSPMRKVFYFRSLKVYSK